MRFHAICATEKTKFRFGKATKSRIRWQSTLSVPVDAHFAGTRIEKTGRNFSIAVTAAHTKENGKNLKIPAATIYKNVMDALEVEHLEEEKLTAAIQRRAGRKAIEGSPSRKVGADEVCSG